MNLLESIVPFDRHTTDLAQDLLGLLGINITVQNLERLPKPGPKSSPLMIVSNHRSFLDPFLLTSCLNIPINFVCHRYMGNIPVLREILQTCGGFPLSHKDWYPDLLQHATDLLDRGKTVGIFPEGASPILNTPAPQDLRTFYRGFAHLALQTAVPDLQVLPVAICSRSEWQCPAVPLSLLRQIDPLEPLFQTDGWHPVVLYQDVTLRLGEPFAVKPYRDRYHGRQASIVVKDITNLLSRQISELLAA
jgi:1-acyl-sn-glycerol-3-phosphate acyltransferase